MNRPHGWYYCQVMYILQQGSGFALAHQICVPLWKDVFPINDVDEDDAHGGSKQNCMCAQDACTQHKQYLCLHRTWYILVWLHCRYPSLTQQHMCMYQSNVRRYRHRQPTEWGISCTNLLENKEYNTGSSLDHPAKVLCGISSCVWRPYKYRVYDRGTTAPHGVHLVMVGQSW